MINILDKHNCCGCSACVQICPMQCINFCEDEQGFWYPYVDKQKCINCGMCDKACPYNSKRISRKPLQVYSAINPNEEIRMKSSSGGIFSSLAECIINREGVVFGARYDENWDVIHDYTEDDLKLDSFRGSKYVQSKIGNTYKQVHDFLKNGRIVLFSGTSCQILGLKNFLRKDYDNLITVDVVCHGVPSPMVWRDYLKSITDPKLLEYVSMKDKQRGWKMYDMYIKTLSFDLRESKKQNNYLLAFVNNLSLRLSCFNCPAKNGASGSDLTLADYWGIEHFCPEMDDNKGTSFVCVNTKKGGELINCINISKKTVDFESSITYNSCFYKSTHEPSIRKLFWKHYSEKGLNDLKQILKRKDNVVKKIIKKFFVLK